MPFDGFSYSEVPQNDRIDRFLQPEQSKDIVSLSSVEILEIFEGIFGDIEELDPDFICDVAFFISHVKSLESAVQNADNFDIRTFLSGDSIGQEDNDILLANAEEYIMDLVDAISTKEGITLEAAYKKAIGLIDAYDKVSSKFYHQSGTPPKSTFIIRTALLLAAQRQGVDIESWMVYTKGGKPCKESDKFWGFLDNWKNWVPEAQGKFAKFIEIAKVKAEGLSSVYGENQIVLLKGGFGAGKTRLTKQKFEDVHEGVVAPDRAKSTTLRSLPGIPHYVVHAEGSQLAYKLFDGLIRDLQGSVVYDSSLADPDDIEEYIQKVKQSERFTESDEEVKLVVYDVARKDEARFLSVLRREVSGEDPRIPPDFIKRSAVKDKIHRHECMQVAQREEKLHVEYHFLSGNERGWDTQEVAVITSGGVEISKDYHDRFELEGLVLDELSGVVYTSFDEEELSVHYDEVFQQSVTEIMDGLSPEENEINQEVFQGRVLISDFPEGNSIDSVEELYALLDERVQEAIPESDFLAAFDSISVYRVEQLFMKIASTGQLSYLDLPFGAAAAIHCKLLSDPWT